MHDRDEWLDTPCVRASPRLHGLMIVTYVPSRGLTVMSAFAKVSKVGSGAAGKQWTNLQHTLIISCRIRDEHQGVGHGGANADGEV